MNKLQKFSCKLGKAFKRDMVGSNAEVYGLLLYPSLSKIWRKNWSVGLWLEP